MSAVSDSVQPTPPRARLARVALVGNPNCGKTTIFNALTGLRYKVANYPGVTVEKKEGQLKLSAEQAVTVLDLPGLYNLEGNAIDERIAAQAVLGELDHGGKPDLIVSVVDATNLERNLYLTTQLIDLGIPMVLALNMTDAAEKRGLSIKKELLARALDIPVTDLTARKGIGVPELKNEIAKMLANPRASKAKLAWLPTEKTPPNSADPEYQSFEATHRYSWLNKIVHGSTSRVPTSGVLISDWVERLTTHRVWGSLIFVALMALIFQAIFLWASVPMNFIDSSLAALGNLVGPYLPAGRLRSLIVDGVIAGVGSVLIFVPQIAILFFFLGLLEDSGYLCRAAFLMDRVMRPFGLQGRSFIPLLSSFACAIPGILSTRTIPSMTDRLTTIMIAPLMSCSARLPVYTLLIAAFVPNTKYFGFMSLQGLVLLAMYLLGIFGAAIVAWLLKNIALRGTPAILVMEMPNYKLPSLKLVARDVWDRVMLFLKSAGTIILACSIVLWFLASYPSTEVKESYAGRIGHAMEPVLKPVGFNWEIGIGILASFAAREVFISALATVYNLEDTTDTSKSLISTLRAKAESGTFTLASALSLMVFYVFACQCMSTLAVCRRETGSWGWTAFMFIYMTALAYVAAWITYRLSVGFI